jgi:hypothetical protein
MSPASKYKRMVAADNPDASAIAFTVKRLFTSPLPYCSLLLQPIVG